MSGRPARFEDVRYLGDKRTQVVYDLDEARNRGYRPPRRPRVDD